MQIEKAGPHQAGRLKTLGMGLAAVLLAPAAAAAALQLDLERAIELTLQQNRNLVLSAFNTQSAGLGIVAAESEFRLSVRPGAALNASSDQDGSGNLGLTVARKLRAGTQLSARVLSEEFAAIDGRQERVVVEVSQPLLRFSGRLVNEEPVVRARSALLRARRQLEAQKQDLIVEVVRAYEDILRLEQQQRADEKSLERATALFESTRAKEAVGRVTRVDTLRVELQQGQAQSRVAATRERLGSARRGFAELLGFHPDTTFDLSPTRLLDLEIPTPEQAVAVAFKNSLDYAQALQDQRDSARGVRIARKGLWPDLRLTGRYEHVRDPVFTGADDNRWFAGLSADTDFNPAREQAVLAQARLEEKSSAQFIRILELSIARDLQQRTLAYRRNQAELKISERNLKHAGARLELARRLFEIGRGDNFSVTDAEEAFVQAQSQWLLARSNASVSGYELMRAMGTLTELPVELKPSLL